MAKSARPTRFCEKWRIRWHDHDGRRQSAVFATYDEADKELTRRRAEVDAVASGRAHAPPKAHTFAELASYWLTHRAPEKRSRRDDASMLKQHLIPAFGKLSLAKIGVEEIDRYKASKATRAPKTVRNHLTLLGTMLRLAVALRWLLSVPAIKMPVDRETEVDPPCLKTREEISRFIGAAKGLGVGDDPWTWLPWALYSTAVFTGLRAGELAGLTWECVDLEKRSILVRRSYDGPTKTRQSRRYVPIVDALLPVMRRWREMNRARPEDWVFPSRAGTMLAPSHRVFQEVLHRTLDLAGFARPKSGRAKHAIHFHSLRHTFASHWRLNGGAQEQLIRVMGHTSARMTAHYQGLGNYHAPEQFRLFSEDICSEVALPNS